MRELKKKKDSYRYKKRKQNNKAGIKQNYIIASLVYVFLYYLHQRNKKNNKLLIQHHNRDAGAVLCIVLFPISFRVI